MNRNDSRIRGVRLSIEVDIKLTEKAESNGMTVSDYLRELITYDVNKPLTLQQSVNNGVNTSIESKQSVNSLQQVISGIEGKNLCGNIISPEALKSMRNKNIMALRPYSKMNWRNFKAGEKVRIFKNGEWVASVVPEVDADGNVTGE